MNRANDDIRLDVLARLCEAGCVANEDATGATSACIPNTFHGASTATGRTRPLRNWRKASAMIVPASVGWLMRSDHLVRPRSSAS